MVAALIAAVLAARPDATMRLFYKPEYAIGAHALSALVLGYVCFSLFIIAGTIINGSGRTLPTTIIGVVTLAATVAAEWIGIRVALETGADPLFVAAVTTAATMTLGLVLVGGLPVAHVRRGAAAAVRRWVRVAAAYAAALATGWAWEARAPLAGQGRVRWCRRRRLAWSSSSSRRRRASWRRGRRELISGCAHRLKL